MNSIKQARSLKKQTLTFIKKIEKQLEAHKGRAASCERMIKLATKGIKQLEKKYKV